MSAKRGSANTSAKTARSDRAVSYNEQKYTGMKIGRSHKWNYDKGQWKETKVTPDLWQFLAHQNVAKQTANDYTTSLTGLKFKIAHKRAGSEKWSATPRTQRKRMISFLRSVLADLEKQRDREALGLSAQPTAAQERTTRVPSSGAKRAAKPRQPARRVSTRRAAREATRARTGQRSRRTSTG